MTTTTRPGLEIAVDTGGTFTDLVAALPSGARVRLKVPSTPHDPGRAVVDAIEALQDRVGLGAPGSVRHGTTVATNAVLEGALAEVVWITNAGFEDVLLLRRQARPDLYALHPTVPPPPVRRDHTLGIVGRLGPEGEVLTPLEDLPRWIDRHRPILERAEAFAVSLLHAYAHPAHERAVADALEAAFPGRAITTSHALAPVFREYERASTVAMNAALTPIMSRYLEALSARLSPAALTIMGSDGGLMGVADAAAGPVHTVLSGPAGGVRGAWQAAKRHGRDRVLALDMGGTSADVSVMVGELAPEDEGRIGDHPLRIPLLPIETVGAGGGSVAYVDEGGVLRVGPRSAGAQPGPACYGRGGIEPTVTDAHVALGRLPHLLGGAMSLDVEAARRAVGEVAARLGAPVEETAEGILAIAEATMARACKSVSLARGHDPRTLTLVAFGGAGGLHACALAEALGCPEVLFPSDPGVLSAEGILDAPRSGAATRSVFLPESRWRTEALRGALGALLEEAAAHLPAAVEAVTHQAFADCRYQGQTYTLPISVDRALTADALRAAFDAQHQAQYGHHHGGERAVELVALRAFTREATPPSTSQAAPAAAAQIGPRAISTYSATLWLPEGWSATPTTQGGWLCRRVERPASDHGRPARRAPMALALEIHRQRISAIAEEMGATLMRAAFSANIKERQDYSCAIFDAEGQMVAHAAHIPVHLGSTPLSVAAAIEAVPMGPGAQVMLNDPFAGGTHLPDVTVVAPVYLPGGAAPIFYVANRAHHADVGGISPGSLPAPRRPDGTVRPLTLRDEGFCLGPTLIDDAVRARFAAASRTPDERRGDLQAQEAANLRGAARLQELVEALGVEATEALNGALLDYAERRMRATLGRLPEGTWRFTDKLDGDGVTDAPVDIPVTITLGPDHAVVDWTQAPPSVAGPLNGVRAIAVSATFYVFRCLAGALAAGEDGEAGATLPANAGLMRAIEVRTRPGTVIHAEAPAAVSAGNVETSQRMVDALLGALAQGAPERVPAASGGSMNNVLFGGVDPTTGAQFVHYETLAVGAGGAAEGPGAHGIHTHMTNTLNTPVEALERAFPVHVVRYGLRDRPVAAPSDHPGGVGIVRAWRFTTPVEITLMTERRVLPPWPIGGGAPGALGLNRLITADGAIRQLPGKVSLLAGPGDVLEVHTPGGGHWRP